ncbi:MAG: MFS transporter [Candidatus Limiplasma sp.]|nr:MFS transporter [Candidatus Limiplasma sp.]
MPHSIRTSYTHTIFASYLGCATQAVVNNFAPLLFLTFQTQMGLTLEQITLLTTLNFSVQLLVDFLSVKAADKIGYRPCVVAAHVFSAAGLAALAVLPQLLGNAYLGLMLAVVLYAVGGGLIEVLVSPIVEACPTDKKEAAMSMLHSFYCWGHVAVVLLSTAFFQLAGIANWRIMACLWAVLPLINAFYFSLVPIRCVVEPRRQLSVRSLFGQKLFWLLLMMMVCAGAAEQGMSQWASVFAESGLNVSKTMGDLAGPCAFALLMGASRALYGKYSERLPLRAAMTASAILCIACYAVAAWSKNSMLALAGCALCGFSVGIFWPGTFSTAVPAIPGGGTAMFALMALAGDLGCAGGPTVVGLVADAAGGRLTAGLAVGMIFPALMLFGVLLLSRTAKN